MSRMTATMLFRVMEDSQDGRAVVVFRPNLSGRAAESDLLIIKVFLLFLHHIAGHAR